MMKVLNTVLIGVQESSYRASVASYIPGTIFYAIIYFTVIAADEMPL